MNSIRFAWVLTLLLATKTYAQQDRYAIINASVITMHSPVMLTGQTVIVENGIINFIGPARDTRIKKGTRIINAGGKFLLPGLFDMHTHFFFEQGNNVNTCREELKLMIANGITTARITCGDSAYLHTREMIKAGHWAGPRLIVTSPQVVGSWPWMGKMFAGICKTPGQAEQLVKKYKDEGYDQIKISFMVKPEVYDAIIRTAAVEDLPVVGHVGPLVKLPRALAAGQQIEHMDEFIEMLLPDTSYNHGQSVSDMNIWSAKAWRTVPHLDYRKIPALVDQVKRAGIYVTPTNYFFHSFFGKGIDSSRVVSEDGYQYIPKVLKDVAWRVAEKYKSGAAPGNSREKYISIRFAMIRELWKAGVPLMAGSDSPQWFLVTGFALHDELENLVEAGLTPFAALETATINPARFLKIDHEVGTIQVGKKAELILLDKNPLTDIRNTRNVATVFMQGKVFTRNDLTRLLEEARVLAE